MSERSAAGRVARSLTAVLAWPAYLVVFVPLYALSRLAGGRPLDSGWATPRSAFVAVDPRRTRTPQGRVASGYRRSVAAQPVAPAVRHRRWLRAAVPVAAVAAIVSLAPARVPSAPSRGAKRTIDLRRRTIKPVAAGPRSVRQLVVDTSGFTESGGTVDRLEVDGVPLTRDTHEHEPWAPVHLREIRAAGATPDFFLGTRLDDVGGRTINIRDGVRLSYTPSDPTLTVWFFGASTMYGFGQRDDHTIPSAFARSAEVDGIAIRAVNFGVSGDVNWVETQRFIEALSDHRYPKPDLVVFYDGVNDASLGRGRVEAGSIDPDVVDRGPLSDEEHLAWIHFNGGAPEISAAEKVSLAADLSAAQYRRGADLARRIGGTYRIPIRFVYQPQLFSKKASPADVALYRRLGLDPAIQAVAEAGFDAVRSRSGVEPIDLSAALDGVTAPVFIDAAHTNELGARVIAEAMFGALRPTLRRLAEAVR